MNLTLNKPQDIIDLLNFYKDRDCLHSGIERVIGSIQVPETDLEEFFAYRSSLKVKTDQECVKPQAETQSTDNTKDLATTEESENSPKPPFRGIWTDKEDTRLLNFIKQGMCLQTISRVLNRTNKAVLTRARSEHKYAYPKNEQRWVQIKPKG